MFSIGDGSPGVCEQQREIDEIERSMSASRDAFVKEYSRHTAQGRHAHLRSIEISIDVCALHAERCKALSGESSRGYRRSVRKYNTLVRRADEYRRRCAEEDEQAYVSSHREYILRCTNRIHTLRSMIEHKTEQLQDQY
jgi:hypothetical protein